MRLTSKFLILSVCFIAIVNCRTPIVIVPGIGGSQIEAKLEKNVSKHVWCSKRYESWYTLWLSIEELLPWVQECWTDNLMLQLDSTTGKMRNTPGVYTRTPDFGNTTAIEWLDPTTRLAGVYFYPLIDSLTRLLHYKRGKDLNAAPYDFRYDPGSSSCYFTRLKNLIESTYTSNGNRKVMLLAHSMGTPYSSYFLQQQTQEWKDKYLKAWMTISGVYAGAVKALLAYISGDGFGIPSVLDKPRFLREFQRSFSSLAYILPDSRFWKADEILAKTENQTYTVQDYDTLFKDVNYPLASKIIRTVPKAWNEKAPNVKMYCFHGNKVPTPGTLNYAPGYFPDFPPDIDYVDGDGTVNLRSLVACQEYVGKQNQPVIYEVFDNAEHNAILGDARLVRAVIKALQED